MKKVFFLLFFLLLCGTAYARIYGGFINAATIHDTVPATVSATNSLLLEDGSYLLHENSDTMQLES